MSNYSVSEDAFNDSRGGKKKSTQEIVTLVKVNFAHFLKTRLERESKKNHN